MLCMVLACRLAVAAAAGEPAGFTGSAACAGCHAGQAALWQASHHALAMQPATPETVLGDFGDASLTNGRVTTLFHRDGGRFMVRTDGPDGTLHDFPVAYTFGVFPLQQYLIALPGGRYQALGLAWDTRAKESGGQRWYPLYPGQSIAAGDPLHWTGRDQNWNFMCAGCHSTGVQKNYDAASATYATSFAEVDVGCEACHGPGSRHIAWAQNPGQMPEDLHKGITAWLDKAELGTWVMNPDTGIARRSEKPASATELNACAGCHARASQIAPTFDAATPFLDAHLPVLLEPGMYHPDGQIDGEVFEYGSFLQSRMHAAGVTCANCHEPHGQTLRAEGNALCAQCHMPAKFDVPAHHHHPEGSAGAQCANCHMATKTYMGVDARRDHSIRVPRPDLSVKLGTPNACTQCHTGKPAEWAAGVVAGWFPGGRQTQPHYGLALAAGRAGRPGAERALDALLANPDAPGIARGSAALLLRNLGTAASLPAWRAALADADPLVRIGAVRALPPSPPAELLTAALPLLSDPTRAVRIETARALAGADLQAVTAAQRAALAAATAELVAAENVAADRPESHLNLALLAVRQQQPAAAEAEYRAALRIDPNFVPALVNLADLDRMRGQDADGVALLRKAIALEPGNAEAHHALGLLLVRQHDYAVAVPELRRASELAPDNAHFAYTYAIALNSTGAPAEAMARLKRAHAAFPANVEILSALLAFARQAKDYSAALGYARALQQLFPAEVQLALLIRSLEQQQPR